MSGLEHINSFKYKSLSISVLLLGLEAKNFDSILDSILELVVSFIVTLRNVILELIYVQKHLTVIDFESKCDENQHICFEIM